MSHRGTKIIAVVSALLFLTGVAGWTVAFVVVNNQKETYLENERARAEREAFASRNTNLIASLEKTQEERTLLTAQIIHEEDVIDLLSLIETLGKEQGVLLTTKSLTVDSVDNTFETLAIQLEVEGSYEAVTHMLNLLEHIPHHVTVESVQLTTQSSDEFAWQGQYQLRVSKYKKNET
jgi:Tfp pilus assembly protein PilO